MFFASSLSVVLRPSAAFCVCGDGFSCPVIFFVSVVIFPFLFARIVVSSASDLMMQFLNVVPACFFMNEISSSSVCCEWKTCVSVKYSAEYEVPFALCVARIFIRVYGFPIISAQFFTGFEKVTEIIIVFLLYTFLQKNDILEVLWESALFL